MVERRLGIFFEPFTLSKGPKLSVGTIGRSVRTFCSRIPAKPCDCFRTAGPGKMEKSSALVVRTWAALIILIVGKEEVEVELDEERDEGNLEKVDKVRWS